MSSPVVEILGELWELPDTALSDRWARCLRPGVQGQRLAEAVDPYHWTSAVTVRSIEARAGELLMFHAAGISDVAGNVVALIGPSGTGKSTAARTLCRDDFGYVTDETVAVTPNGTVIPFPKPIAMIPADGGIKLEVGPDELGLRTAPGELRLAGLVLLERQPGLAAPVVERLALLDGIVATAPHMSALPRMPSALAHLAGLADACGGVHRVTYGEAAHLLDVVREVLEAGPVQSGFQHHPARDLASSLGIVRSDHHDAIEADGGVLILHGSTCLLIGGIGALVWLAADHPRPLAEVTAAVIEAAGEHPEADRLVRAAVKEVASQGVLTWHKDPSEVASEPAPDVGHGRRR